MTPLAKSIFDHAEAINKVAADSEAQGYKRGFQAGWAACAEMNRQKRDELGERLAACRTSDELREVGRGEGVRG